MALHVMDEAQLCLGCPKPKCQEGCPIKTDIPSVIKLLKAGNLAAAGWKLFENNPLPLLQGAGRDPRNRTDLPGERKEGGRDLDAGRRRSQTGRSRRAGLLTPGRRKVSQSGLVFDILKAKGNDRLRCKPGGA